MYKLDEEINRINEKIYQMLSKSIENCRIAFSYYLSDSGYDEKIVIDDDEINALEREIESLCMQVMLKEKIYSADLRKVTGGLKMIQDIERISDHAFDIKWMSDDIKKLHDLDKISEIEELICIVNSMIKESMTSFVTMDETLAMNVIIEDDNADKKYWQIVGLLAVLADKKEITSLNSIYQIHIDKFLERIGDEATNIAEWVIYMINGYHKDKVII